MNNETLDRIEDYIRGEMNESEAIEFRRELEQNSELAEYYWMLNGFNKHLIKKDQIESGNKIKQIFDEYINENYPESSKKAPKISLRNISWLTAAAVLIIAMAVYFLLLTRQKSSPSYIYRKHFAYYNHTIQPRDAGDSIGSFYNGMQFYKAGSYQDALNSFLVAQEKYEQISAFYIGLCYLNLDQYSDAAVHLEEAVALNGDHKQDAEWYLALAYLAEGKVNKTENIIKQITNQPKHYYYEQARNLLEDMADLE